MSQIPFVCSVLANSILITQTIFRKKQALSSMFQVASQIHLSLSHRSRRAGIMEGTVWFVEIKKMKRIVQRYFYLLLKFVENKHF